MLAQVFCQVYDDQTSDVALGIPLRHTSDINVSSYRSTVKQVYDDIIEDMTRAAEMLKESNGYASRPNKASAYAALSRIYLSMERYSESAQAATESLSRHSALIDLNTLDVDANFPYSAMNEETLFFACGGGSSLLSPGRGSVVSPELLALFDNSDLRRKSYFRQETSGQYSFKGNYMGFASGSIFSGLTTSEVLLNRAESYVRLGELSKAREDLNRLLSNRIDKNMYRQVAENDPELLLKLVLDERRKELINRSIRWTDLRRLNKDPKYRKTIVRVLSDKGRVSEYALGPDPENYVFKIPKDVIDLTGMLQN